LHISRRASASSCPAAMLGGPGRHVTRSEQPAGSRGEAQEGPCPGGSSSATRKPLQIVGVVYVDLKEVNANLGAAACEIR
jgi:hypothetical protein